MLTFAVAALAAIAFAVAVRVQFRVSGVTVALFAALGFVTGFCVAVLPLMALGQSVGERTEVSHTYELSAFDSGGRVYLEVTQGRMQESYNYRPIDAPAGMETFVAVHDARVTDANDATVTITETTWDAGIWALWPVTQTTDVHFAIPGGDLIAAARADK